MDTDWRRAFHPNSPISGGDLDSVASAISGRGYDVGRDCMGRIDRVISRGAGREILRGFFAPTDDPADFLPRDLVRELDAEFGCGD